MNSPTAINRRAFLEALGIIAGSCAFGRGAARRPPRILLRSSWQTVNIGDIAHTPGVLRLLETYLPEAELYLWPSHLDNGVDRILKARFPRLKVVQTEAAIRNAFNECDFLLHGSGPSLVAQSHVIRWRQETGKPYGIYGITFSVRESTSTKNLPRKAIDLAIETLSHAEFVYFRDSKSLSYAKQNGCESPIMEFAPDGAFACDLRDDDKALAFLNRHELEPGKFLCCIPRLRYTPYWTIPSKQRPVDPVKHARNEEMKDHDHIPLRRAITDVVNHTELKILLCPEDQTHMKVGKEMILDKLPDAVRRRVVWRPDYWLTGEAVSTYTRSAGLFGNDLHSPIMCVGHGVPAIVCRWAEQTHKGFMWDDIGLGDWLFDLDDASQWEKVAAAVLDMAMHPEQARAKARQVKQFVEKRQKETMFQLAQIVG